MKAKWTTLLVSSALSLGGSAAALAQTYRSVDDYSFRIGRAPEWNLGSAEGQCRLRIWVDDRAQVNLRGDQIIVRTETGRRSFDQGSVCNQPLPFNRVNDFRITAQGVRGRVEDVLPPNRRNNFTGEFRIEDPQPGGETYDLLVTWHNPDVSRVAPLASNDPFPYFDEMRACQDRVRGEFLTRNREGDAYVEFTSPVTREEAGPNRERIHGQAWARSRFESRPIAYECMLNDRTNRVLSATYDVVPRGRVSSLQ